MHVVQMEGDNQNVVFRQPSLKKESLLSSLINYLPKNLFNFDDLFLQKFLSKKMKNFSRSLP